MSEQPVSEVVVRGVMERLFADPALSTYVILDGASVPDLLGKLEEHAPEHVCLYRGELAPDLAECAPYLVRLTSESPFTHWVVEEGWGKHWGIFALAASDLERMRRHFRTFLMVQSPEGKRLYFRYYDPRVLREYLPTCNEEETRAVFGPVGCYLCEGGSTSGLHSFRQEQGSLRLESLNLSRDTRLS
jgi:hypothetical protein